MGKCNYPNEGFLGGPVGQSRWLNTRDNCAFGTVRMIYHDILSSPDYSKKVIWSRVEASNAEES